MARRRVRGIVGTVVAALVGSLVAALPAVAADVPPPVLTSVTAVDPTITPGQGLRLAYAATHPTETRLGFVSATYIRPGGKEIYAWQNTGPLTGVAEVSLPDGVANGVYRLAKIELGSEYQQARVTYFRDGSTSTGGTHRLDFTKADVTLSGSHEDSAGPALSSVQVTPTAQPGSPVVVTWKAVDDHPVVAARFNFQIKGYPASVRINFDDPAVTADLSSGRMSLPLKETAHNGSYPLMSASFEDSVGNTTYYRNDGTTYSTSPDVPSVSSTHSLDFARTAITVSGSIYRAPLLRSLDLGPRPVPAGSDLRYVVDADAAGSFFATAKVTYLREDGTSLTWDVHSGHVVVPTSVGRLRLDRVVLTDPVAYSSTYRRDGTLVQTTASGTTSTRHSIDLSAADIVVVPSAVTAEVRPRPQGAVLTWRSAVRAPRDGVTGYRVLVNPGGRVIDVPATSATEYTSTLKGLTNGTKYTIGITAQSVVGPGPTARVTVVPTMSRNVFSIGDVNDDRRADLFAHLPSGDGRLVLYRAASGPSLRPGVVKRRLPDTEVFPGYTESRNLTFHLRQPVLGTQSQMLYNGELLEQPYPLSIGNGMTYIDQAGDFVGDYSRDLLGIDASGFMRLYPGRQGNLWRTGWIDVGPGWSSMATVFATPDVTGDRNDDVMAVDGSGVLWIYPGNGHGGFGTRKKVGSGWSGMGSVFAGRDFDGDRLNDLMAITMDGKLRIYPGRGNGTFRSPTVIGHGWNAFL